MTGKKVNKKKVEQALRTLDLDVLEIRREETSRMKNISYDFEYMDNPAFRFLATNSHRFSR